MQAYIPILTINQYINIPRGGRETCPLFFVQIPQISASYLANAEFVQIAQQCILPG